MMSKTSIDPIKVDLDEHTLDKLLERQPHFINYTHDDTEEVIKLLNENYNSGILKKRKHRDWRTHRGFANYELTVLNLFGEFLLKKHQKLPDTYIAKTFKLLRTQRKTVTQSVTHSKEVTVEYSFNLY